MRTSRLLLAACLVALAPALLWADNWPQWRGPKNDGHSTGKNVPSEWSGTKNVAWKLELPGIGCSTPCVWGDRLFLTCREGDTPNLLLLCIGTDGKEKWRRSMGKTNRKGLVRGDEGNDASASPCTDGKHVYAFVGGGDFAAFDFEGKEVWRFNAQDRYGKFRIAFGMHSTPVLHGDRLYQQLFHDGGGFVFAIDKATGKEVWKIDRPSDGTDECFHSYASAFMWDNGKSAYLVVHGNDYTTAHDLKDGKELWRVGDLNPQEKYNRTLRFVASPVCAPDLIVIPSAKRGVVLALKPDAEGKVMRDSKHLYWRKPSGTPDVPSPLVVDDLIYLCGEGGGVTCVEAKTGKPVYQKPTVADRYRGSPVYADGKIMVTARGGTVTVFKAGRTFEKVSENKLPDIIPASPAIADGKVYLRGFKYLWAIAEDK